MHIPVLTNKVLKHLDIKENQNFVDCTVGAAGHTSAILAKNKPEGKVLGIDRDREVIEKLRNKNLSDRLQLAQGNFSELDRLVEEHGFNQVHGILFDFGVCSHHFERSGRGFTYRKEEPLDMRFDVDQGQKAQDIVNKKSKEELENILTEFGEEKYADSIASEIVESREEELITTTTQLVEVIREAVPDKYEHQKKHFATKTFQALRVAVNDELKNIKKGLRKALRVVRPEGRIVAISFHSLEDRIVKKFFKKKQKQEQLKIITKNPINPTSEEIEKNPRSRSAKLRAVEKL